MKQYWNYRILAYLMLLAGVSTTLQAGPVHDIPNLDSITFWERTGGSAPTAYTFAVNSSQLTSRLSDPLSASNNDFAGVPSHEFYDVFYSNASGTFDINGEFLTIEGFFDMELPWFGGLNLAEIALNFLGTPTEYGNWVASYVALGNNAEPGTVGLAIDGDLQTHTTMGNTIGQTERLRLTLGFNSSSGPAPIPEPNVLILLVTGLLALNLLRLKHNTNS
ncbi:MAG: PEP-CTERM sorting domain-containing protein [Gallionellaceae bacterium]|nr:PEP-CTERM sorting domain-containing protein [Gallionellaceae bacterium]